MAATVCVASPAKMSASFAAWVHVLLAKRDALLAQGRDDLGERLIAALVGVMDAQSAFAPFLALIRGAVSNELAARMLREFLAREVLERLAETAAPDAPNLRASLAASQVMGLAMTRYVVRVEPLATASPQTVAAAPSGRPSSAT